MQETAKDDAICAADSAYSHWARSLHQPGLTGSSDLWVQPALVRFCDGVKDGPARLATLVAQGALMLDPEDHSHFGIGKKSSEISSESREIPDSFTLYWPEEEIRDITTRHADLFEVVHLERPILAPTTPLTLVSAPHCEDQTTRSESTPIVAVIDDGIGFLNTRFCRTAKAPQTAGRYRTRFHAVWLQAFRSLANPVFGPAYAQAGQVLYRADINALLRRGPQLDEGAVYRALNRQLLDPGAHRSTEYSFTHGTHILDTAAGADPESDDPVIGWPLLAVQLPPEAVDNTAGTQLEPCIVKAVRWILHQAQRINSHSPVIINISFATFAGPKDGTKAIEAQITQLLSGWQNRTGRSARVVYAFGNAQLNRQAARMDLAPGVPRRIDWRLQPNDFAPSYLELRPIDPRELANLTVRLTAPGGVVQNMPPLPQNTSRPLLVAGRIVGRYYHIGPRVTAPGVVSPAHGVLAMAPTSAEPGHRKAPAGGWQLEFTATCPVTLRLEVQRGDTPGGYRLNGRQSYLDHPLADGWDAKTASYTKPEPGCPITREGTHSSFVTALSHAILAVGAARGDTDAPSPYSAQGSDWTRLSPSLAAIADRGTALRGLVASGTFSGSGRALNGTSAAAARVTRAIGVALENQIIPIPAGPADITHLIEAFGATGKPENISRQGAGILHGPDVPQNALVS